MHENLVIGDDAYSGIYETLDIHHHIDRVTEEGEQTIIHQGYGSITVLAQVERFVRAVLRTTRSVTIAQIIESGRKPSSQVALASYYSRLNGMIDAFDSRYVYSPHVDLFFRACSALGITPHLIGVERDPSIPVSWMPMTGIDLFNALIEKIRGLGQEQSFLRALKDQEVIVEHREASAMEWEEALFNAKSRYLLIPLTLEYKREYRDQITPKKVKAHLRRFLENRRMNSVLSGIKEYAWRIEEGDRVGLHVHLLIAYDGESRQDMSLSKYLCKYWEKGITKGMGYARSASMYKGTDRLRTYGACAGQINRYDTENRELLRNALRYMVKADQHLKRKECKEYKTFDLSRPSEHSGLGRIRSLDRE